MALLAFALGALFLAFVILAVSATSVGIAIFLAILLVGILALGGMAMAIARSQRKGKPKERAKLKKTSIDPDAAYRLTDDGEILKVENRNSEDIYHRNKRKRS